MFIYILSFTCYCRNLNSGPLAYHPGIYQSASQWFPNISISRALLVFKFYLFEMLVIENMVV